MPISNFLTCSVVNDEDSFEEVSFPIHSVRIEQEQKLSLLAR